MQTMDRRTLLEWLRLVRTPGLGRVGFDRLLRFFDRPEALLAASPEELARVPGIQPALLAGLRQSRRDPIEPHARELDRLAGLGGRMLMRGGPDYPPALETLPDPPPLLFVIGDPAHLATERRAVAVVGSRDASHHGVAFARRLGGDLAARGLVTVSGVAMGIDSAAHQGALDAGGVTVGVLATGLDVDYPPGNGVLKQRITAQGCLVSEAPLGTPPIPGLFPPRNRIISGLSRGVVVVEAAARSGSLITARLALEQGREVFAVPGPPGDPRSRGNNALLRQGACLTEGIADILEAFSWSPSPSPIPEPAAPGARSGGTAPADGATVTILEELGRGASNADELARRCHLTVADLSRILLHLEMAGVVMRLPGNRFSLVVH